MQVMVCGCRGYAVGGWSSTPRLRARTLPTGFQGDAAHGPPWVCRHRTYAGDQVWMWPAWSWPLQGVRRRRGSFPEHGPAGPAGGCTQGWGPRAGQRACMATGHTLAARHRYGCGGVACLYAWRCACGVLCACLLARKAWACRRCVGARHCPRLFRHVLMITERWNMW